MNCMQRRFFMETTPTVKKKTVFSNRIALLMLLLCGLLLFSPSSVFAKAKKLKVRAKSQLTSVQVSWSVQKGAVKYKVYRADATEAEEGADYPVLSEYKKVKTLKGNGKTTWTDKTAEKGRFHAYVVKAYNKKGQEIASSFNKNSMDYACCGVPMPNLGNNGYGENFLNSRKTLYLWIQGVYSEFNLKNTDVLIFRKTAGGKKYKKLAAVKMKGGTVEYADKSVKAGKTYYYKAQFAKKSGGKTYKSKKTKALVLPAVNFSANYKLKSLTPAGTYNQDKLEITFSMKNKGKYNGKTTLYAPENDWKGWSEYYNGQDSYSDGSEVYPFRLTAYSKDNKPWKAIPPKGISLPKKAPLYLKGEILRGDHNAIHYGLKEKGFGISSTEQMIHYEGPGAGVTYAELSLSKGSGSAYQEWD